MFPAWLADPFFRLAATLPQRALYAIGLLTGTAWALCDRRRNRTVQANLRIVEPGANYHLRRTVKPFVHFHWTVLENIKFSDIQAAWISSHVRVQGMDRLGGLRGKGFPAIHLASHIGNWEIGARLTALLGIPLKVVVQETQLLPLERAYRRRRESAGLNVAPVGKNAAREALDALRRGDHLATVFDLEPNDKGMDVEWFGAMCRVNRGPFWLAEQTGAPIVPTFCLRTGAGKFQLIFEEPIFPKEPQFVQKVVTIMETYQRRYWDQWAFFRSL